MPAFARGCFIVLRSRRQRRMRRRQPSCLHEFHAKFPVCRLLHHKPSADGYHRTLQSAGGSVGEGEARHTPPVLLHQQGQTPSPAGHTSSRSMFLRSQAPSRVLFDGSAMNSFQHSPSLSQVSVTLSGFSPDIMRKSLASGDIPSSA